ncbi:MAG: VWA domain-containing protein, partial [Bradyrhizobium sp.]
GEGRMEGASRAENIAETDFRNLADSEQIKQAHLAAARLAHVMRTRLTRRDLARRRGYRIDLRRTIHGNISRGGVPINLVKRQRKQKPLRLVVLLDASGSMSMYTGVFLRFIHGVLDEFREAEAFLFHTRLAHVSDAMKERNAGRALDRLSIMAQGAGGGTRIGESLQTFNRWHASRVIHSRTCVMIVSDGYETGDVALLGREMAALGRRCRRIVWLNPMMGWQGYTPAARGIKVALPYVDLYAPANTLQSLTALEPYLARL